MVNVECFHMVHVKCWSMQAPGCFDISSVQAEQGKKRGAQGEMRARQDRLHLSRSQLLGEALLQEGRHEVEASCLHCRQERCCVGQKHGRIATLEHCRGGSLVPAMASSVGG